MPKVKNNNNKSEPFEATLWQAADKLRFRSAVSGRLREYSQQQGTPGTVIGLFSLKILPTNGIREYNHGRLLTPKDTGQPASEAKMLVTLT